MKIFQKKWLLVPVSALALAGLALPQFKIDIMDVVKVVGVGAAVRQFNKDINKAFNGLTGHKDTPEATTKVVPILSVKIIRGDNAIGAAQVSGPKAQVDKVTAVAQPETELLGIRARGFIPVSSRDVVNDIKRVEGVAVTGIVDLKL